MKINEYPRVDRINSNDVLILDRVGIGTRSVLAEKLAPTFESMLLSPLNRKLFYRGKNLGTTITNAQKTAIQNGTFEDMFLGDYWTINSRKWIIADFDYWYNRTPIASSTITYHHLVLIPDNPLLSAQFYSGSQSPYTSFACFGTSTLLTSSLSTAQAYAVQDFGTMLKDTGKRQYFKTGKEVLVSDKYHLCEYTDSPYNYNINTKVLIMNCIMALGYPLPGVYMYPDTNYNHYVYTIGIDDSQLSLFKVKKDSLKTGNGTSYWLRDMESFAPYCIDEYGRISEAMHYSASAGVRPVVCLG